MQGRFWWARPEQIIDKFGRYHAAFGHELSGISTENPGLAEGSQSRIGRAFRRRRHAGAPVRLSEQGVGA